MHSALKLPRARKPPRRIAGPAPSNQATTVEEYLRKSFFSVIDTAMQQMDETTAGKHQLAVAWGLPQTAASSRTVITLR